ncbi:MAG TPA: hypothetical protein VGO11_07625 [Chthoniobacteraceae bacterium]|jgi:hypothetical protein|nr:hypothetical protein [Chthoniobacteraceae bacterium]
MTRNYGKFAILAGAIATLLPLTGSAQEFFREYGTSRSSGGIGPVTANDYSYQDVAPSDLAPLDPDNLTGGQAPPNFQIGPIRFSIAVGVGVEFNDNVNLSDKNRQSDIVIRPSLSLDAYMKLSDRNILRFSLGVSYAKYLNHSEYDTDGLLFAPTSALEYTFGLGTTVLVSLRERFSYQEDIFNIPTLSNEAKYGRYENQAGIEIQWDPTAELRASVGYDHYNLWTKEQIFDTQDRSIDTIFFKPSYEIAPHLRLGLNASYSFINFDSDQRHDGGSLLVGPFVQWGITDKLDLFLEGGFQSIDFDGNYTPTTLVDQFVKDRNFTAAQDAFVRNAATDSDTSNDSYYIRFELNHKPNDIFQQRLSGSKTLEVGFFTNYYDIYHVEYAFDWKKFRKTEISPTLFYEYYETSGELSEKAHRVGAALGIRHYLTNSITLGLDYRFIYKDSNFDGFDYYQNLGFLSVYYKF